MHIKSFRIENYKGYFETEEIKLSKGFNVIIGQNNSGKTALAEAISLNFENRPHRSTDTAPYQSSILPQNSYVLLDIELGIEEFLDILADFGTDFYIPIPEGHGFDTAFNSFRNALTANPTLRYKFTPGQLEVSYLEAFGEHRQSQKSLQLRVDRNSRQVLQTNSRTYNSTYDRSFAAQAFSTLQKRIYMFKAERLNVGRSKFGSNPILAANAANLPEVLNILQGNTPLFQRYNELVRVVFPEILQVSLFPVSNTEVGIRIWNNSTDLEREDLAITLEESGTGLSQVLAMLYVVVTSRRSSTIIIDEPNSFLHPGAVRKLLDIFKHYPHHQYIITTHSPTALSSIDPQSLLFVRKHGVTSTIEHVSIVETQRFRSYLSELGVRFSDIFGADNILWVEGPTEERCFPKIIESTTKLGLMGTVVVGVVHTGDFSGKHRRLVLEIYRRLSDAKGIVPPALGFIFDCEGLTIQDREDLTKESNGLIKFISRRMYENYLLVPEAIASVANSIAGFRAKPVLADEISNWLTAHKWDTNLFRPQQVPTEQDDKTWVEQVDGTKVLKALFSELSEQRVLYDDKPLYGLLLTQWIIENEPNHLIEITDILRALITQE